MRSSHNFIDLTGRVFGRWTVQIRGENKWGKLAYICRCECGNSKLISGGQLSSGNSQSCGCWQIEQTKAANTRHGLRDTPEYGVWVGLKNRCFNPACKDYARYAGTGITVCAKWRDSFEEFFADVGRRPSPKHSIDRFPNPAGNYEPGNVRWATAREQAQNRRDNKCVTYDGRTMVIAEWARLLGCSGATLDKRIARHGVELAITMPINKKYNRYKGGVGRAAQRLEKRLAKQVAIA
jgi:hypothetical protein